MHSSSTANQNSKRPQRLQIKTEIGAMLSLPSGNAAYSLAAIQNKHLLAQTGIPIHCFIWGISPVVHNADTALQTIIAEHSQQLAQLANITMYSIETNNYSQQMPDAWKNSIPKNWLPISPEQAIEKATTLHNQQAVQIHILYTYAPRLFPSFWGKHLGKLKTLFIPHNNHNNKAAIKPLVVIPGTETSLLVKEIAQAFSEKKYHTVVVPPQDVPLLKLSNPTPHLFFSINGAGLDPFGETFYFYQALQTPVALWCVDNPWHILCNFKAPWWKELTLFVTDASFIPGLKAHGAQQVYHLPLAAGQHFFTAEKNSNWQLDKLTFIGRTAFPQKTGFFAGLHLEKDAPQIYEKALTMLATAEQYADMPHYHWWAQQLHIDTFWQNNTLRLAGLGAEECALKNRSAILHYCAEQTNSLSLIGDQRWKDIMNYSKEILPAVDYYTNLPSLYASAPCIIDIPSLLLPAGATQRHFDVWAAKGVCLSQKNFGTNLFPTELTQHTSFTTAADLLDKWENLQTNTWIAENWFECIITNHCYAHRINTILQHTDLM